MYDVQLCIKPRGVDDASALGILTLEARTGVGVGGGRSDCDSVLQQGAEVAAIPFESFVCRIFSFRQLGETCTCDSLKAGEEALRFCEQGVRC